MCVSVGEASFSGTTLYVGRLRHPEHGLIHVLGYQNTAVNLADGPNAMLLPLPARHVDRGNFVPVGAAGAGVLQRMVAAVRPIAVGIDWMGAPALMSADVEVFEHDVYTVVLAADPLLVPEALRQVPRHRRPAIGRRLLEFYALRYPGWPMAVCCFDNADAQRAAPLLIWYQPLFPDRLTAPALDCHTGEPPDPDAEVAADHWVVFGTDEAPPQWGEPVEYAPKLRWNLRRLLPDRVVGSYFSPETALPNGDFAISHEDLLTGDTDRVERLRPGG